MTTLHITANLCPYQMPGSSFKNSCHPGDLEKRETRFRRCHRVYRRTSVIAMPKWSDLMMNRYPPREPASYPLQFAGTDGSEWVSRNTSRDRWDMFSRSLKGSQLQDVCGSGGLTQWNAAMSLKNPRQAFSAGFAAMAGLELGGVPAGGMKFNML